MKVFKIGKYTVVCRSESMRHGFRHIAEVAGLGYKATRNYINRTWEGYTFESVLKELFNQILQYEIEYYKQSRKILRLTAQKREEILNIPEIKEIQNIIHNLDKNPMEV